jgi:putative glutamine amidotransferase
MSSNYCPIIGINGMRWPDNSKDAFIMDKTQIHYIEAVEKGGGVPISLPVLEHFNPEIIKRQVSIIDALLIQGGLDVDPSLYGEERKPELEKIDEQTDKFLIELIKQAVARKIPILGICRGLQILNVYYGGTLYQDLKYAGFKNNDPHKQSEDNLTTTHHGIKLEKDSILSKIMNNKETLKVNSFHHQAINKIGKGLLVDAKSDDGIIEAIHLNDDSHWVLGLQFHPEQLMRKDDEFLPIFKEFIQKAREMKNKIK